MLRKLKKINKVTDSQDDVFVVSFKQKHPKQVSVLWDAVLGYVQPSPFDKLRAGSTGLDLAIALTLFSPA